MPGRDTATALKLYPIPALIKAPQGDLRGQIVKLTAQGFLVEVPPSNSQPGEFVTAAFKLAGSSTLTVTGRIVKYYSQWGGGSPSAGTAAGSGSIGMSGVSGGVSSGGSSSAAASSPQSGAANSAQTPSSKGGGLISHLMEVHFQNLPVAALESISTFLRLGSKIGRK